MFSPVCRRALHTSSGKGAADWESRKKNVVGKYLRCGHQHAIPRQPTNRSCNDYALHCHRTAEEDVH